MLAIIGSIVVLVATVLTGVIGLVAGSIIGL